MLRDAAASWDTVVIGSGPGGLTAALALARAGQRVLVLEQHYLPGGWTHSFTLEGYRFSPGVHYIGNLQPGGALRRLYESFELGQDLEFYEMNPDGFDHFLIDGEQFDQPKGMNAWVARLKSRFPHESAAIDRYFALLVGINEDVCTCDRLMSFPEVLTVPFRAPRLLRWGFRTLAALLDETIHDPMLRAVLSAQCGNHGLAPSRVSLPLHASMTTHYFDGAFYPRGGAKRIAAAYIKALRRHGGQIRLSSPVTRIVVEHGRAVGVEVANGEMIRADNIVCNADPARTFGQLLGREDCRSELRKLRRTEYSVSSLSIFCGVAMDLEALGLDSGNYWFYRHHDVDRIYREVERSLPPGSVDGLFLTITTLKDPGHAPLGTHAIEMFTFVPYGAFEAWQGTDTGDRQLEYQTLKASIAQRMLNAAEEIIPGLQRNLRFMSIGTPLTNDFYCLTHRGAIYGTAKTPWQVGPFAFSSRGPVANLHMCGASTFSHGVAGATMSGLVAAQHVLGLGSVGELVGPGDGSLRILSSEAARHEYAVTHWPRPDLAPESAPASWH
ncbi:MAG: NAD(P)/FAD-dependent oxidoreductase [Polyangiaceae bacterium]|nr:NAD(P)/FAD-dependent oxidoreductase [Polyangiaceae bacterium]